MRWNKYIVIANYRLIVLLAVLLGVAGCAQSGFRIVPLNNHDAAYLSLNNIVGLMLRSGFSDEQIHLHGPELRDVLAKSGGARVYNGDLEEATFTVDDNSVYVSSKSKGMFIYNLTKDPFDNK